jgi:hypothetical protein
LSENEVRNGDVKVHHAPAWFIIHSYHRILTLNEKNQNSRQQKTNSILQRTSFCYMDTATMSHQENPHDLSEHVSFLDNSWDARDTRDADTGARTKSLGESTMASGERRGSTGAFRPTNQADIRDGFTTPTEAHGQNHHRGPSLRDKLVFDLDQAWQRSLKHHLDELEDAMDEDHPRPRADRLLLGHAESGDYALECEDDLTIVTETNRREKASILHLVVSSTDRTVTITITRQTMCRMPLLQAPSQSR